MDKKQKSIFKIAAGKLTRCFQIAFKISKVIGYVFFGLQINILCSLEMATKYVTAKFGEWFHNAAGKAILNITPIFRTPC